jgi:hypothetical protein
MASFISKFTIVMSALRRLSNDDVKKIFDCVHNNKVPPQRLAFQIVVVGPNGMRLSPPSFKFEGKIFGSSDYNNTVDTLY